MEPGRVPAPLRGPPVPVAPPEAGLLRYARPWPPCAPVGPLRALPGGPASAPGLLPAWAPAAPWAALALARAPSAPFGSLRGSLRPVGGPPAPVGAVPVLPRRPPLRRGRVRAWAGLPRPRLGPRRGGRAVPPARRCGLAAGVLALGLLRAALRPVRAAPVPPPRAPVGRPGYRHGPPRLPPSGGRWGRPAAALCRAAPPSVGVSDRAAAVKGPARRPGAALDRLPRPDLRTARGGAVGPGS